MCKVRAQGQFLLSNLSTLMSTATVGQQQGDNKYDTSAQDLQHISLHQSKQLLTLQCYAAPNLYKHEDKLKI